MVRFVPASRFYAVLAALSLTASLGLAQTGQWQTECPQCAQHLGGPSVYRYPTEAACKDMVARELAENFPFTPCHPVGGTAGAAPNASTGSLTGDIINLGAQMFIAQHIQNPYGQIFASNFTTGFLKGFFANDTPEAQQARAAAEASVRRQQEEQAARERAAAQQRLDAMFARLNSQLKLSGGTAELAMKTGAPLDNLQMKLSGGGSSLPMKMGDIAVGDGYGIKNLPGIYTNGEATGDATAKMGDGSSDSAATSAAAGGGISGLPGLNLPGNVDLNHVTPQQAAQVADASFALDDPQQRGTVEEIALKAAARDPELNKPSNDPLVQDYQDSKKAFDGAAEANAAALQQASEAQGRAQADQTALAYAQQQIAAGNASDPVKQAYVQMQAAAGSDEEVAVKAREMFEETEVKLTIARDDATVSLGGLAPPSAKRDASLEDAIAGSPVTQAAGSTPFLGASNANQGAPKPPAPPIPSGAVKVPSFNATPKTLVETPGGGKLAYGFQSAQQCLAQSTPSSHPNPSLEELRRQLKLANNAYDQLARSMEEQDETRKEWKQKLLKAGQNTVLGMLDDKSDEKLEEAAKTSKEAIEQEEKIVRKSIDGVVEEYRDFHQEMAGTTGMVGITSQGPIILTPNQVEQFKMAGTADINARMASLNSRRMALTVREVELEKEEKRADLVLYLLKTGRDKSLDALEKDGETPGPEAKKNEGGPKEERPSSYVDGFLHWLQEDETSEHLHDALEASLVGTKLAVGVTPVGALGEFLLKMTDLSYDILTEGLAIGLFNQMGQNNVKFNQAQQSIEKRIAQLTAEMSCYSQATTAERSIGSTTMKNEAAR